MRQTEASFGFQQLVIVGLTLATALIHFTLLFPDPIFILNGLGYLALLAALYLPLPQLKAQRSLIRPLLLAYTAGTVILWLVMGVRSPLAFVNKAIEIALIVLLWLESRQGRSVSPA